MAKGKRAELDRTPLTEMQAERLAGVAGLKAEGIVGRTVAELREDLDFKLDPRLLFYRKVCGKVVVKDPVTGNERPVPFATVHVEDTDCSFLSYFPATWPWGWYFPLLCRREEIATAVTDACGNFCVYIPRWDVDWILGWRRKFFCEEIFIRPSIRDLLEHLVPKPKPIPEPDPPPFVKPPRPGPDPIRLLDDAGTSLRRAGHSLGFDVAHKLAAREAPDVLGPSRASSERSLARPAFPDPVPPPVASELRGLVDEGPEALADKLQIDPKLLGQLDLTRYIGPFPRCFHVLVPEWWPVIDVPDVTFRVTQDVDGDGTEDEIYTEGYFDVRWDAGSIPPVTIYASSIARSVEVCGDPPPNLGPCAEPGLYMVGTMPLLNPSGPGTFPFVDTTTGYAVRPNRPHDTGRTNQIPAAATAAASPLTGALQFWGCNHETPSGDDASFYRVLARTKVGGTWGPLTPIFDNWWQYRFVGSPPVLGWKHLTADGNGWYEVIDDSEGWIPGSRLLLWWHSAPNGMHELVLELGDGSKNVIHTASGVLIQVDHSRPSAQFTKLEYKRASQAGWTDIGLICPTIHRNGEDIQIRVSFVASAAHLRSIQIGASGCGGGSPQLTTGFESFETGAPAGTGSYWHKTPSDNAFSNASVPTVWDVPSSLPNGAYNVGVSVHSRAFFPGDGHGFDPANPDVTYNPAPVWTHINLPIAIVD